jgi:hypothetical protein
LISNDNAPATTMLQQRKQQEAAESYAPKPLTKVSADETSQVERFWLKDVAPKNISFCKDSVEVIVTWYFSRSSWQE